MIRVGFIFSNGYIGGVQTALIALAEAFQSRYEICVYLQNPEKADPVVWERLSQFSLVTLPEIVESSRVLIFDGGGVSEQTFFLLRRYRNKVIRIHGGARLSACRRFLNTLQGPLFAVEVGCSESVSKNLGFKAETIYIEPRVSELAPKIDSEKKFDLLILGRMRPIKNHRLFLDIVAKGGFSFIAVGGTSDRSGGRQNAIETLVRERARPGVDEVTGVVPDSDLQRLISSARVAICTSDYEGLGGLVVEPMACGVPVVARRSGGVPEAFPKDFSWLIMDHDARAEEYVPVIRRAMETEGLGAQLSDFAHEKFGIEEMVRSFDSLIYRLGIEPETKH